jgi:LuxR family maltose regulon positive regulatory protein
MSESAAIPFALPAPRRDGALQSGKLNPPRASATQVTRDAVCDRIQAAGPVRLVLVRAPAGFGKTTAMVQARDRLAAVGVATAWLTLERTDNDISRFLRCLRQAVAQIVPDTSVSETPLAVLEALAGHAAPFALFLDDFELITEPAVLGLLREIIDHLPRRGQLVLGSRSQPDLGLGRLRAAGQLLEIDTEHLRFSLAETQRFFALRRQTGVAQDSASNSAVDIRTHLGDLHRKTEGWIAALWLASMALDAVQHRHGSVADFVAQFSGSDRAVADFLAEDVLERQSPEVRDFLLRTSVLRHLNAPLCQALNPRSDARRILAQLDAANLFITPIADSPAPAASTTSTAGTTSTHTTSATTIAEPEWRYHSLFADFLRTQLLRERPDELARLHLAASGWYESQGRPVPAIDHAIEGGDLPHATALLALHASAFLEQGRMRLLARWFAALPSALLRERPMLQMVALWASALTRGPWEALEQLQQSGCEHSADAAVRAHVNALRPMLLAMMDRVEQAAAIGREQLAQLPSGQPFADRVLCNAMAHVMGVLGERDEANRLLDAARRGQQGGGFNRMYSESVEGLIDLQQGRLRQATARFRLASGMAAGHTPAAAPPQPVGALPAALGMSEDGHYPASNGNAWAGVLYAGAVYEAHQPHAASHLLNVYLPLARDVGLPDHMILSHTMRSRIAFQRGDIDAALQAITDLEYLGHHRQLPRVVASARLERARVLVLQGQADAAALALDRADDAKVWQRVARHQMSAHDVDDMVIGRLRWQVRFGDAVAAAREAGGLAEQARQAQRQRRALRLQVLQALALQRAGQADAAQQCMTDLLRSACAEGFVRLLLDEGQAVGALARRVQTALADAGGGGRSDPIFDDWLQRLLQIAGPEEADDSGHGATAPASAEPLDGGTAPAVLAEPLTRKEIRVLQLLAEGYSNGAMAEKLFVSDSTVRTHLRNINMKLNARSRTQAVAIARRLGVMS